MRWVAGSTPPHHLEDVIDRLRANPDVTAVAIAFVDLQQERESADYDHLADFTRPSVLLSVETADRAVRLAFRVRDTDDFRAFLGLIVLRTSIG